MRNFNSHAFPLVIPTNGRACKFFARR